MVFRSVALSISLFASACSQRDVPLEAFCQIDGQDRPPRNTIARIHRGQTKAEVEAILGQPDYSPIDGVYYHSTGGDCEFGELKRMVPCGYVMAYSREHSDSTNSFTDASVLIGCSWGGIAE
jgi:hypothetical protein